MEKLKQLGNTPVDFYTLSNVLKEYKYPADKLSALEKNHTLIRLKKGLYVVSDQISGQNISRELIANHLYGPSYISFEYALSWHGLIPERVHMIRSLTTKRSRVFSNPLGRFEYVTAGKDYFSIGIKQITNKQHSAFLIGSPEKSLCDMIVFTRNLRIQSVKAIREYLQEDLRTDVEEMAKFDLSIIEQCLQYSKKKNELRFLLQYLKLQ